MNRLFASRNMHTESKVLSFALLLFVFGTASPLYAEVTYRYTGLKFDHQDPANSAFSGVTIELTTPKPLSANLRLPDVPQFQAQGYRLVITDGVNTIDSSDEGFSFGGIAATNAIYTIDENGLPETWSLACELKDGNFRIEMSSRFAPGVFEHGGGDSAQKFDLALYKRLYFAWTRADSHVGIPVGPGTGVGKWSIKNPSLPMARPQRKDIVPRDDLPKPKKPLLK